MECYALCSGIDQAADHFSALLRNLPRQLNHTIMRCDFNIRGIHRGLELEFIRYILFEVEGSFSWQSFRFSIRQGRPDRSLACDASVLRNKRPCGDGDHNDKREVREDGLISGCQCAAIIGLAKQYEHTPRPVGSGDPKCPAYKIDYTKSHTELISTRSDSVPSEGASSTAASPDTQTSSTLAIAGHLSRRMLECYSHIRAKAKRCQSRGEGGKRPSALIWHREIQDRVPANSPTILLTDRKSDLQVIGFNGRDGQI